MKKVVISILSIFIFPFICSAQMAILRDDNGNAVMEAYPSGFYINYQYDVNGNRIGQTIAGNLLPVTLIDFSAIKQPKDVRLKWSTSQEINTDKFMIEFSKDGITFTPFDMVLAKGNSSVRSDYSTIHCCPVNGVNYYRLKILDKDGKIAYSQIRAVVFSESPKFKIYPNPVTTSELNISFNEQLQAPATLVIYSSTGSAVLQKQLLAGSATHTVNVSYLATGTYQLVVTLGKDLFAATFARQ